MELCYVGCKPIETLLFGFITIYRNLGAGCHCKGEFQLGGVDVFSSIWPASSSNTLGSVLPVIAL